MIFKLYPTFFIMFDNLFELITKIRLIIFKPRQGWLVGFVALRPKSTAMVIAGRSVHLTTLFPGQA